MKRLQVGEAEGWGVFGGAVVGAGDGGAGAGAGGVVAGPGGAAEAGPVDGPAVGRVVLGRMVAVGEGLALGAADEGARVGVAAPEGVAVGWS